VSRPATRALRSPWRSPIRSSRRGGRFCGYADAVMQRLIAKPWLRGAVLSAYGAVLLLWIVLGEQPLTRVLSWIGAGLIALYWLARLFVWIRAQRAARSA
jgi:hypothetical protein